MIRGLVKWGGRTGLVTQQMFVDHDKINMVVFGEVRLTQGRWWAAVEPWTVGRLLHGLNGGTMTPNGGTMTLKG